MGILLIRYPSYSKHSLICLEYDGGTASCPSALVRAVVDG